MGDVGRNTLPCFTISNNPLNGIQGRNLTTENAHNQYFFDCKISNDVTEEEYIA
jgi:hypothetical protein